MMGANHLALGARGEELAAGYLQKQGYRILVRNFRCRYGEIDVIAEEGKNLVFIEVKSRSGAAFGDPLEAVDRRKRGQLERVARYYLEETGNTERFCRFDVVAILLVGGAVPKIELIRHAFDLDNN